MEVGKIDILKPKDELERRRPRRLWEQMIPPQDEFNAVIWQYT